MRMTRFIRLAVAMVCLVFATTTVVSTALDRTWRNPERPATGSSVIGRRTVAGLRRSGIALTHRQRDAVLALVKIWETRPDLVQAFPPVKGGAPLPSLLDWGLATSDYGTLALSEDRDLYLSVANRLGMRERPRGSGADVDIVPYLLALVDQRVRPQFTVRPALWELIRVWRERADVRIRFASGPGVDTRGFLRWSYTMPADDPSFRQLTPVFGSLARWDLDLPDAPWSSQ